MFRCTSQSLRILIFLLSNIAICSIFAGVRGENVLGVFVNAHGSHLLVYAAVVNALLERGHNVTVVTEKHSEGHILDAFRRHPSLRHMLIPSNATTSNDDSLAKQAGLDRVLWRLEVSSQFLGTSEWAGFVRNEKKKNVSYDLMILGYLFNDFELGIAAEFDCPVALIWTAQPVSFVHQLVGSPEERFYVTQAYDKKQRSGLKAVLFGLYEKVIELFILERMQERYEKYFPSSEYPSFEDVRRKVSLVLCNHHRISEGPIASYVPAMIDIGGIQSTDYKAESLPEVLGNLQDREWIFISLGTRFRWTSADYNFKVAFLEVFRHFPNYTIIWTYDGEDCEKFLFAGSENSSHILCAKWWPQSLILSHPSTKLFITHGGKGSLSEALYHAVPVLGIPMFSDQYVGIQKAVSRGFGLALDIKNFKQIELSRSLKELLGNRSYADSIASASQLYQDRPQTPRETATFWLEYVMRHKGAFHMRSPRLDLSFWQYHCFDTYAFLLCCALCFAKALNSLERWLDAV